ncbi:MAG: hypothetical protein IH989_00910 [Planctomycetes bacterium]|nr:hypothetical protein [Planctomycetota bacterium]
MKRNKCRAVVALGLMWLAASQSAWGQGFVVISGDDADDWGHCGGDLCGNLFPNLFDEAIAQSRSGGYGIVAIGVNSLEWYGYKPNYALISLNDWNSLGPNRPVTHARTEEEIAAVNFADFAMIYIPSSFYHTTGGITTTQIAALNLRQADVQHFVNELGGSLIALTEARTPGGWGWLPVPLTTRDAYFSESIVQPDLLSLSPATTSDNLSHCCFHNVFTGPAGYSGLRVLAVAGSDALPEDQGLPVFLGGAGTVLSAEVCDDGMDNDGDGLIDCLDPDCEGANNCFEIICMNGVDDDNDGIVDCDDPDCAEALNCHESDCTNGIDDDGNGFTDCDDDQCADDDACDVAPVPPFGGPGSPPDCSGARASQEFLWPPNHRFHAITIGGVVDPDGDTVTITIESIFQDEPVRKRGGGSGKSSPDGDGVGTDTASLRAEREADPGALGNGRVYHVDFRADDGRGGSCTGTVYVCVGHDQRATGVCADEGPLYDSTQP